MFLVNVTRYYGDDQHVQDAQHHDHMYIDVSASHYHMLQLQTNSTSVTCKTEHKIVNSFLPISLNIWFECSKEPSRDGSFEYPQHMFWLRNKKINFLVLTLN